MVSQRLGLHVHVLHAYVRASCAHSFGGYCKDCVIKFGFHYSSQPPCLPTLGCAVQMPSRAVASAAVVLMGLVWASVGLALLIATEYLESPAAKCAWRPRACHRMHAP